MSQMIDRYFKLLKVLLTAMLIVLIIPVFLQIVARFIPFIPRYIWTEEIARFAFVWIILIGSSIAVRERAHFRIEIFPSVGIRSDRFLLVAELVLTLTLAIAFLVGGFYFVQFGMGQHSEISELPMVAIYIAWPLAGFSWIVFLIERTWDEGKRMEDAP